VRYDDGQYDVSQTWASAEAALTDVLWADLVDQYAEESMS
jgi:hypothetical protein